MQIILQKLDEILNHININTSSKPERWMNIKELCELTSLSKSTIRRNIYKGALKCSNATGKLLFKVSDVESWLNNKQGV